jgi:hypothetical protein
MSPAAWPFNSDSRTSFLSALFSAAYPMNCWVCASRLPWITAAVYLEAALLQCVLHLWQQTDCVPLVTRVRSICSFAFRLFCICKCEIIRNADAAGALADSAEETATCLTTFTAAAHRGRPSSCKVTSRAPGGMHCWSRGVVAHAERARAFRGAVCCLDQRVLSLVCLRKQERDNSTQSIGICVL